MLALKVALWSVGFGVLAAAAGVILNGLWLRLQWLRRPVDGRGPLPQLEWRRAGRLAAWGVVILLGGRAVVLVPSGMAGVRVSQLSGTRPGTLYPGVHIVRPLIDDVALYDTRDQFLSTGPTPNGG